MKSYTLIQLEYNNYNGFIFSIIGLNDSFLFHLNFSFNEFIAIGLLFSPIISFEKFNN